MASLAKRSGRWVLQFVAPDKRRRTIHLGGISKRNATSVKSHVEAIVSNMFAGQGAPDDTARWLNRLPDALYDKLAKAGLAVQRERATLAAFVDAYISARNVKESTTIVLKQTRRNLVEYFGESKPLREISLGDADDWAAWLRSHEQLSESTAQRRAGIAKQFFKAALRKRLIDENPFADLKSSRQANRAKDYFVTRDEAAKVLKACPDAQWRLLFALSRYGGLRCPSEHLCLTWADIDWEQNRMTIRSPKTEHHDGQESRIMPIFPELRPYLESAFDEAPEGTTHVITRYRDRNSNLRTQLLRIIQRAGLNPWPKLFHNLRATRQTELEEQFPSHVVCAWIGNSQTIARKHYLQVTADHFERATAGAAECAALNAGNESQCDERAEARSNKAPQTRGVSTDCIEYQSCRVGVTGFEHPFRNPNQTEVSDSGAAQSAAVAAANGPVSTAEVLTALAAMTPADRRAIIDAFVTSDADERSE